LYDPPKDLMKLVAAAAGVPTPPHVLASAPADVEQALEELRFPLFVKPNAAGDSVGIDADALVRTPEQLRGVAGRILTDYDQALIEEYIDGREFTVLVAAATTDTPHEPIAYLPLEFVFPPGECFKSYELKVKRYLPECNRPCLDPALAAALRTLARDVFRAFGGVGYARLDFRQHQDGRLHFLEINFTCSVFYAEGSYGSADYILQYDGIGQAGFLQHIVAEGLARHRRQQKKYRVARSPVAGDGIVAAVDLQPGELIFEGEGQAHRIVTNAHVDATWDERSRQDFRRYAFPLSPAVSILWPEDPAAWAPQNHACDPNTEYRGLNVYARRHIRRDEELTLDYSTFCGEAMEEFACHCGRHCRGWIRGSAACTRRYDRNDFLNVEPDSKNVETLVAGSGSYCSQACGVS
jgi:D-alanine-D-alanine ligase